MSYKIRVLLSVVLTWSGGVVNVASGGAGAGDAAAEDTKLLAHVLKTIDAATDEDVLMNVTSTILSNLCACVRDALNEKHVNVINRNDNVFSEPEAAADEDLAHYKTMYAGACHDLPLQLSDVTLPQATENIKECSRFDFVRKYEESFVDDQLKSKFKTIMYDILIGSKDRHKYEIKKYNLYEKPQTFDRTARRSVIIIITLNLSKPLKAKAESGAVRLSEMGAALEDKGDIYVDFIDPAYDPKHTKISSAKNVSYCNLRSVLAVLLESERNNLTKTFKLIRKGGTIKVYTSLSTNYAYERYSDFCCYKNNTSTFCETSMKDVDGEESKFSLGKSERREQLVKYKEAVSKIKTLMQIYNKKPTRKQGKAETARTEGVVITNDRNHYYSNLVGDHRNRSTDISDRHFTYHYKKLMTSKLNKLPNDEIKITSNSSSLATSDTSGAPRHGQAGSAGAERAAATDDKVPNTVEAKRIYLKVCNYDLWSNTTVKEFSPYNYIKSNYTELKNTSYAPVPPQQPTGSKLGASSWTTDPIEKHTSTSVRTQRPDTKSEGKFPLSATDTTEPLADSKKNNEIKNEIRYNRPTNNPRSRTLRPTTSGVDNVFTDKFTSGGSNHSYLKTFQGTSPLDVLNEVYYESLPVNSLTPRNANVNKITKRWTTANVTYDTLQKSKGLSSTKSDRVTTTSPSFLTTLKPNKQFQHLKVNSPTSRDIDSTSYNVTRLARTDSSREAAPPAGTAVPRSSWRNRSLTLSIKSRLPKRFMKGNNQKEIQKKKGAQNYTMHSRESKITSLNDTSGATAAVKSADSRNAAAVEATTTSVVSNIKINSHLNLRTSTVLPTSPIDFGKAQKQIKQKDTITPSQSFYDSSDKTASPRRPTVLHPATISGYKYFDNHTKRETSTTRGSIAVGFSRSDNDTKLVTQSNSYSYPIPNVAAAGRRVTAPLNAQNVTRAAFSLPTPQLLSAQSVATTSSLRVRYKKNDTKSIFNQLGNDFKSRNNQARMLTFNTSERYPISTSRLEETKTTTVSLRTYYNPSNLTLHEDKGRSSYRTHTLENNTETVVLPQIPKFPDPPPVTSTFDTFKNTIRKEIKVVYIDSGNGVKFPHNRAKTQTKSSLKYTKTKLAFEKTEIKRPMFLPTSRTTDMNSHNKLAAAGATPGDRSVLTTKKNNVIKTTHQRDNTFRNAIEESYFKTKIKNLTTNEIFTKGRFSKYTPFYVDETKYTSDNVSRMIEATDSSNLKDKYLTVENNFFFQTSSLSNHTKYTSSLVGQQMNSTALLNGNVTSSELPTETIENKTKAIGRHVSPKRGNTNTFMEIFNNTKQMKTRNMFTASDDFTLSYNLIDMPLTPQLRLKSKETVSPATSADGQPNALHVGGDSVFLTTTKKMKSNKTPSSKLRHTNTIDISASARTLAVSKWKVARVIDIVDHTRGRIDLPRSSRRALRERTHDLDQYNVDEIRNYKTKKGSAVNFPTFFKATKRANRIYNNFFKITQAANSIADVKTMYPNESYDKKGIERRTSENTANSTLPLPTADPTGVPDRSYKTIGSRSTSQEIAATAQDKIKLTYTHTTGSKMPTIQSPYECEDTESGACHNTSRTHPTSQRSDHPSVLQSNEIVLTTKPIQNNTTTQSIEPHLTGDEMLGPISSTSRRFRAPATPAPGTPAPATPAPGAADKLEDATKKRTITRCKETSNNSSMIVHSNAITTLISKSEIATSQVLNFTQSVEAADMDDAKSVTSKKYSVALSTLTEIIKSVNYAHLKTLNRSVPGAVRDAAWRGSGSGTDSFQIQTSPAIDDAHLETSQFKINNMSEPKKSSDFKDIVRTDKIFLQNLTTFEQTLDIDVYKSIQRSNESLNLSRSKTKNITTDNSEIKIFPYSINGLKSNKSAVPSAGRRPIQFGSSKETVTAQLIPKINEISDQRNVLGPSMWTDEKKNHNAAEENVSTVAQHSQSAFLGGLSSRGEQNKSVNSNGAKVSFSNTSCEIQSSVTSPDLIKSTRDDVSDVDLRHSSPGTTDSLIDLTKNPTHFKESHETLKETNVTSQIYSHAPAASTYFEDNVIEPFTWKDPVVHGAGAEEVRALIGINPQSDNTEVLLEYTSASNQKNSVREGYESISKDVTANHSPAASVEITHSLQICNDTDAQSSKGNINNTLSTKHNVANMNSPLFSQHHTGYFSEQPKTLKSTEATIKDLLATTSNRGIELYDETKDDVNAVDGPAAERGRSLPSRSTPLYNVKHTTDIDGSNALNTTKTMEMPPDNMLVSSEMKQNFTNRKVKYSNTVFSESSALFHNTQPLSLYDENPPARHAHGAVAPASLQASPNEVKSEISATENYNETLQNLAHSLSNLLTNSKNNNAVEQTMTLSTRTENSTKKTKTICNGPLIIASNVILLTNPESCRNQSKSDSTGSLRIPLIILTNSSRPTRLGLGLSGTNESVIRMDPRTVYNILLENVAKIIKDPHQYLRINDLSRTPLEVMKVGLGDDTNASSPEEKRKDHEAGLDPAAVQANTQSVHEVEKANDSKMRQSTDAVAAVAALAVPASFAADAHSDSIRASDVRSVTNELPSLLGTKLSTKLFSKPTTEMNYIHFTRHYDLLNKLKTSTAAFETLGGTVPYKAYFDEKKNKNHSDNLTKPNVGSRATQKNKINRMGMKQGGVQFNPQNTLKSNLGKLSNPFKMVANKDEASLYLSAGRPADVYYRNNKHPIHGKETSLPKANTKSNNGAATPRTRPGLVTAADATNENRRVKYNSYQPASHLSLSDASLDSNMQLLLSLNANNRKAWSDAGVSVFQKFHHKTTDFKDIFKLGRKDESDDRDVLKYNRRYKSITEKLKTSSPAGADRYNESRTSARQVTKDLFNFTRKQRTFFTINTKDFFSQRRFYSKDIFKDLTKARRVPFVLQYPATPRATHVVLRPVFRNYGVVNLREEHSLAAPPSARKDAGQYENILKEEEKSKLSLWQDKIVSFQNLLLDELKSNVLEKPAAAPAAPATERGFLAGLNNYNDLQAPTKIKKYYLKYLTGASNNKIAKNLEVYRRKLEPPNVKNISTTTDSSSRRSRRTIFFLSPTVPYNRYF